MAGNGSEPRRSVISKVVAIIRSFDSGGSLTVTEIAQVADLSLSTTHRLVHELAAWGILHRGDDARYEIVLRPGSRGRGDRPPDSARGRGADDRGSQRGDDERRAARRHRRPPRAVRGEDRREPAALRVLGRRDASGARDGARQGVAGLLTRGDRRPRGPARTPQLHVLDRRHRRAAAPRAQRDEAAGDGGRERRAAAPATARSPFPSSDRRGEAVAALEVRLRDVPSELPCVVPALMVAARGLSRDLGRIAMPAAPVGPVTRDGGPAEGALPRVRSPCRGWRAGSAGVIAADGFSPRCGGRGSAASGRHHTARSGTTGGPCRTATRSGLVRRWLAVSSRDSARAATTTADWITCSW